MDCLCPTEEGCFHPLLARTEPSPSSSHLKARARERRANAGVLPFFFWLYGFGESEGRSCYALTVWKAWKRYVKPDAPGPLSQEALVALEMTACRATARRR